MICTKYILLMTDKSESTKVNINSYFYHFRAEDEAEFREFLETVAVVLCSDIEITPDTFHRAARGYGVSFSSGFL